jgi:hypothetical protein
MRVKVRVRVRVSGGRRVRDIWVRDDGLRVRITWARV